MAILSNRKCSLFVAVLVGLLPFHLFAGEVLKAPPSQPDPKAKYLFYMHGRYVEGKGANATYQYPAILDALADKGLIVIGEVRPTTSPGAYSQTIARQIKGLLGAGVPAKNITVAGHSKGGFISMLSASRVQNDAIKFGIFAGCGVEGTVFHRPYMQFYKRSANRMRGRFLVAWDADDKVGRDCDLVMEKAGVDFRNLVFKTGNGHQLFYKPKPVWIDPIAEFALSD